MPDLFPSGNKNINIATDNTNETDRPIGYKSSLMYNFDTNEVTRDGQNKVPTATGIEAWKQWCFNCLNTQRYSCYAYSTDFGIDIESVFRAETKEERELLLEVEIREALMADPYQRTKSITEIVFNWFAPDSVEVTITIEGINDATIDVTATIAA